MSVSPNFLFVGQDYQVNRSVRLRSSASAYLGRTFGTPTSQNIWTYSVWVKRGTLGVVNNIGLSAASINNQFYFDSNNTLNLYYAFTQIFTTTQVFRDPSAWYHIVLAFSGGAASNKVRLYVNGSEVTSFTTDNRTSLTTTVINTAVAHGIGLYLAAPSNYLDGYLAEINFVDGQQLTPSSFGITDTNGIWQPKPYSGTYGTNGFYLNFSDNSAATAAAIGKDYSGNSNNWTPNNISVTAGVTYDSMTDSPTVSAASSNYAVLNPLNPSTTGLSNGNLTNTNAAASYINALSTFGISSGFSKLYAEFTVTSATSLSAVMEVGVVNAIVSGRFATSSGSFTGVNLLSTGNASTALYGNGATLATGLTAASAGEVFQVAIDPSTLKCWIGRGNVWFDSAGGTTGNPSTGANATATLSGSLFFLGCSVYANTVNANFGQRPFTYTPPTGFSSLNTYNLPASIIPNGATVMAASTYTGTGAAQSIVNSGNNAAAKSFQPDLVWIKGRNVVSNNVLIDSVRGASVLLSSDQTVAESSATALFSSINSNGFTVTGTSAATNQSAETLVGWQWQAGQGTSVLNGEGSIFSTVSVNRTAGFSVVTYTGNGTAGTTIGHGLGVAPSMIIIKSRSIVGSDWEVFHKLLNGGTTPWNYALSLNLTAANAAYTGLNNTTPTSSQITLGLNGGVNQSAATYVAYCWSEVAGYSKFGSYTGNGSTDGPFVYLGFRPRWVLTKRTDAISQWFIIDSSRNTYNVADLLLYPNLTNVETASTSLDILSNGFKLRGTIDPNVAAGTYIFAAFAENPFNISRAR